MYKRQVLAALSDAGGAGGVADDDEPPPPQPIRFKLKQTKAAVHTGLIVRPLAYSVESQRTLSGKKATRKLPLCEGIAMNVLAD